MSYLDKLRALESGKRAGEEPTKPTKAPFVGFVGTPSPTFSNIEGAVTIRQAEPFTAADLAEMDRLLTDLARLEFWEPGELEARLSERRRMAPVNVQNALRALRVATAAALAGWPEPPAERAQIVLCRLVN